MATTKLKQGRDKRQIGLRAAAALIVGEVIAVGIFLTPASMAKSLGSPMWLLAVWLVMGAMALAGALCYGELAARFPEAGGGYAYLREAYGPRVAFLYGWMSFLVMDPGITAALGVGLASYIGYIIALPPLAVKGVAIAAILTLALANIRGIRAGAFLIGSITALKLGLLAAIIVLGPARGLGDWSNFVPFAAQRSGSAPLIGALAGSLVAAFFSFGGWWDLSKIGSEVRDPQRTLPRAMAFGVMAVTAVYILTSAAFIYLVPMERVTSGETFAAQAGEALFGAAGGAIFSIVVIVSVFGSLAGIIMTAPWVYYAMARDGLFIPAAAALHARYATPWRAALLQAGLASLLVALGTFDQIIAYFIFVTVVFIALTVAAVFVLRRREPRRQKYRLPLYPLTPLVFLILVAILLGLLAMNSPTESLLGVAVVLCGLPAYRLLFGKR